MEKAQREAPASRKNDLKRRVQRGRKEGKEVLRIKQHRAKRKFDCVTGLNRGTMQNTSSPEGVKEETGSFLRGEID